MNVCADVLTLQEVETYIYRDTESVSQRERESRCVQSKIERGGWEISEEDSNAAGQLSDLLWTVWNNKLRKEKQSEFTLWVIVLTRTVFFLLPRTASSWVGGITVTFGVRNEKKIYIVTIEDRLLRRFHSTVVWLLLMFLERNYGCFERSSIVREKSAALWPQRCKSCLLYTSPSPRD